MFSVVVVDDDDDADDADDTDEDEDEDESWMLRIEYWSLRDVTCRLFFFLNSLFS